TELVAVECLRRGMHGRVTAQHARAMAMYPEPYFRKLAALLKRAGVSVVSDPHTGPLHARVRDLRAAGVTVALGQDDIADAYYPFGRNNMLEVAFLAAHTLWMTSSSDLQALFDMVTVDAARALGVSNWSVAVGNSPDLVLLDAPDVRTALTHHEAPRAVLRRGKVITGSVV
ncbi:MAG: amidohydrolase family protein, partial [Alkalispirochaeta sp.]